ncbi:condensin complex protein MksE [Desulfosediminicola ganghwensis]|uniref:condensin complex protein MksE n=1 Tax=Desulfosediminicola ganghwensis TaxID=2569540 RepID=UPI0010AC9F29|nr:hypothetical protein [Desulfosediminicola ganghwensis]
MDNKYDLPNLAQIFSDLQQGKHLCYMDGSKFFSLVDRKKDFTACFSALGYELIYHPREFFYFKANKNKTNNENIKQMALFTFLLIENLDKRERDLEDALMTTRFSLDLLPHLTTERYRDLMKEVRITDSGGLRSVVKTMARYGFATIIGSGQNFEFTPPIYRFFDLCVEAIAEDNQFGKMEVWSD